MAAWKGVTGAPLRSAQRRSPSGFYDTTRAKFRNTVLAWAIPLHSAFSKESIKVLPLDGYCLLVSSRNL